MWFVAEQNAPKIPSSRIDRASKFFLLTGHLTDNSGKVISVRREWHPPNTAPHTTYRKEHHTMTDERHAGTAPPFMVLAHHRSGSNFLGDVVQAHPDAECLSEPLSMHTSAYLPLDLLRWSAAEYRPGILADELARTPEAARFTRDLSAYVSSAPAGKARGFKETLGFEKLEWFAKVFPGLRIVLLVRDPRAVVRAVVSRNMEHLWDYEGTLTRYARRYGAGLPFPIITDTPVDRVVSSWQVRLWEARRALDAFTAAIVRFEDILTDTHASVTEVMHIVGLPPHAAQFRFIETSHSGPSRGGTYSTVRDPREVLTAWKTQLSHEDITTITRRLRSEMEWLGYE
jgi:sulfotransferase family protein